MNSDILKQQFEACMLGGAIGDAWGSCFENEVVPDNKTTFYLNPAKQSVKKWAFTDDTQLTMATKRQTRQRIPLAGL